MKATCEVAFKITFDPWQEGAGTAILGKGKDGLYCADAVVLSIPRQVGKTFLIGAIVFALAIKTPKTTVLWTAHRKTTAADTFKDLKAFAERPEVARHVRQIFDSANDQRIIFENDSVLHFGARERGFGRGFKNVAIVVFDEAQILTTNGVDDMVPATNRHPNPLIFYIGTPPKPSDPGEHFAMLRREAIDGTSDSTIYIEFSADKPPDRSKLASFVRDRLQWGKANPSFPVHTTARAMLRMLKNLGLDSFLREALGIWDEDATLKPFAAGAWGKLKSKKRKPPRPAAIGIAADVDQVWLSLGASSKGSKTYLGSVLRVRADRDRGAFVAEVARIQSKHRCMVAIDPKGPAGFLIEDLEAAGVALTLASQDDFVQACADIRAAVATSDVEHGDTDELNDAVDSAGWRNVGDRKAFGRKGGDISMLEAVTLARWAAVSMNYDVEDSFL